MSTTPPSTPTTAIVCIGMAGSGKTTFMQRINSHLHAQRTPPYVINLDPAVRTVPFESNIDIRESIDYKEVMKQYNLGPNGGILTSLNLFATKVDQILDILERRCGVVPPGGDIEEGEDAEARADSKSQTQTQTPTPQPSPQPPLDHQQQTPIPHILIDTPGQIEVFVWSASGQILLSSLASSFPTIIAYIIDTPRTTSTSTFMSNMLYACSILYKTKLPMILVFNKTDVRDAAFAKEWMTDFEAFQAALRREEEGGAFGDGEGGGDATYGVPLGGGGGSGYMSSLLNSMSLVLEEFYSHLSVVGVSSMTGMGIPDFFAAVEEKRQEFERDYRPELERRRKARRDENQGRKEKELGRLMQDLNVEGGQVRGAQAKGMMGRSSAAGRPKKAEPETVSDVEDDEREQDDDDDDYDVRNEEEAEMVEPDEHGYGGDGDDMQGEEGLKERYRRAMDTEGGSAGGEDMSFARYIRKSNIG